MYNTCDNKRATVHTMKWWFCIFCLLHLIDSGRGGRRSTVITSFTCIQFFFKSKRLFSWTGFNLKEYEFNFYMTIYKYIDPFWVSFEVFLRNLLRWNNTSSQDDWLQIYTFISNSKQWARFNFSFILWNGNECLYKKNLYCISQC